MRRERDFRKRDFGKRRYISKQEKDNNGLAYITLGREKLTTAYITLGREKLTTTTIVHSEQGEVDNYY